MKTLTRMRRANCPTASGQITVSRTIYPRESSGTNLFLERSAMLTITKLRSACAALLTAVVLAPLSAPANAEGTAPKSTAMLGVFFENDNEGYEPTSDAERARMAAIETQFKTALEATGKYQFVPMTADVQADIAKGQMIAECGGCEIDYGKRLGAGTITWVRVQKISNLIMNMNVYMADVETRRMTFQHSVDLRNNTDESWSRSMNYLLKNYFLPTLV
ncbi:MAG: DUF3280 domain-containing protein, partial [Legionella sp.]|nr:DUF3280 domain-containing protein [Legionella sp.]